jgi:TonB-dependent SusC/RagA subfamily outer membrane receptor
MKQTDYLYTHHRLCFIILIWIIPFFLQAQTIVKGVVVDDENASLIGASVIEDGYPANGTVTGLDGDFTLKLNSLKSGVKIQFLGYKTVIMTPPATGDMHVVLFPDEKVLQEVEVVQVGFGSKARISNVAAISQVNAAQIRQIPTTSIQNSLAGRLPGLFQLQGSGRPGDDAAELFIRGIGTFADVDHSPLILIDDVESDVKTLSLLSSNEIEEVSILKDAGSTSIFGIKGADGVILITTRRGKEGKPKLVFRADFGLQRPTYKNEFLNSYESLSLLKELHLNNGNEAALQQER